MARTPYHELLLSTNSKANWNSMKVEAREMSGNTVWAKGPIVIVPVQKVYLPFLIIRRKNAIR